VAVHTPVVPARNHDDDDDDDSDDDDDKYNLIGSNTSS